MHRKCCNEIHEVIIPHIQDLIRVSTKFVVAVAFNEPQQSMDESGVQLSAGVEMEAYGNVQ